MTWDEIRQTHPHSWVVVEVFKAHTKNGERIIEEMSPRKAFESDWKAAWAYYKDCRENHREGEYLFLHTDRTSLNIQVFDHRGLRIEAE